MLPLCNRKEARKMSVKVLARSILLVEPCVLIILSQNLAVSKKNGNEAILQRMMQHYTNKMQSTNIHRGENPLIHLNKGGYLINFMASPGVQITVANVNPDDAVRVGRSFLTQYAQLLGAQGPGTGFQEMRHKKKADRTYVRYQQTYDGIPIFGAQVILQINGTGGVEYVLSDLMRTLPPATQNGFSAAAALPASEAVSRALTRWSQENPGVVFEASTPELMFFDPAVLGVDEEIHQVWKFEMKGRPVSPADSIVLMDVYTGDIVRIYPLNLMERWRQVYNAENTSADPGEMVYDEDWGCCTFDTDSDNAFAYLGDTYDFYAEQHQRNSIDDQGIIISATVHYCSPGYACPWANAKWSSSSNRIYFGEGYTADDIVAHEYTHGVTQYESGLIYENQPGAILSTA